MIKKLRQLAVVLFLWVLVVGGAAAIGKLVMGKADFVAVIMVLLSTLKGTLLQYGLLSHCWFLWALALLYCLLPLLSKLSIRGKCLLFGVVVSIGIVFQLGSCVAGYPLESRIPQAFRLWTWLAYFLLGGLIYPVCKQGLRFGATGALLAITTLVAVAWQLFAGSSLMPESSGAAHAEYFYDSITCLLWCAALFAFCEALRPTEQPWVYLGSLTMGVYLLHKLLIKAVGHVVSFTDIVWGSGLGFVVVLGLSFVIIGLLKKYLPRVFKLFCAV